MRLAVMSWNLMRQLKQRFNLKAAVLTAPFELPTAVVEIQPDFVAGMRLAGKSNGSSPRLQSIGTTGLKPDTVVPLANGTNITDAAELGRALQAVAGVTGNGAARFGLLLPDGAMRVSTLSFETLPEKRKEADALLQWRMKEALPFPPDEARISHQVVAREADRIEVLAVAVRASVLAEYESALEPVGGCPVLVLPATLALLPLLPEGEETGQLLIHLCSGSITTAVRAGKRLRLWRTRQLGRLKADEALQQAQAEVARVIASCGDHLKVEISQVWVCARPPASPELCAALSRTVERPVEVLKPNPDVAADLASEDRSLFECYGAPLAGLVQNTGQAVGGGDHGIVVMCPNSRKLANARYSVAGPLGAANLERDCRVLTMGCRDENRP